MDYNDSTIHTLQASRTDLKILAGPPENPKLHSLNGDVVTPLFHHLGTSSWHSYDASLIVSLGKSTRLRRFLGVCFAICVVMVVVVWVRMRQVWGRYYSCAVSGWGAKGGKSVDVEFDGRIA